MKYINYVDDCNKESSVAVINDDGILDLVYTEERYNRKKYSDKFPYYSLDALVGKINEKIKIYPKSIKDRYIFKMLFPEITFDIRDAKPYAHHLLHCYESFYTSGYKNAAVLVADGYGDDPEFGKAAMVLYHKIGTKTKVLKKYIAADSLGVFYSDACAILGFGKCQEGKFMGLSAYGKPYSEKYIAFNNGEMIINYHKHEWKRKFCVTGTRELDIINASNFAATVQRDLNDCVLEIVKYLKKMTNEDNLCLSGGIFNNVITNNLVCESGIFKNVWCSPAPSDYGLSVGLASFSYECDNENAVSKRLQSPYLGEDYSDEMVLDFLRINGIPYIKMQTQEIASLLANDNIVIWFQGRSEYGRRALGHRSILANPINRQNYARVSIDIKKREEYRPLACSVPSELFELMFDVKNCDLTEFMLRAIPVKKEMCDKVPACLAIDGTTRPQRLEKSINPEYYDMIMHFYKLTGIPCVVNTSLNGGGDPIIENLKDCLNFFKINSTKINYLVLNGKFVVKSDTINIDIGNSQRNNNDEEWKANYIRTFSN